MSDSKSVGVVEMMQMINEKYGVGLILPLGDVFTPERLLGVETDRGVIYNAIVNSHGNTIVGCNKTGLWYAEHLKYYISDDSDETVSFDEYVQMFYNTDNTL